MPVKCAIKSCLESFHLLIVEYSAIFRMEVNTTFENAYIKLRKESMIYCH